MVLALEEEPAGAARLVEHAAEAGVAGQYQVFVKSPEALMAETIDSYHLLAVGWGRFQSADAGLLRLLVGRLVQNGLFYIPDVEHEAEGEAADRLSDAGLTLLKRFEHRRAESGGAFRKMKSLLARDVDSVGLVAATSRSAGSG